MTTRADQIGIDVLVISSSSMLAIGMCYILYRFFCMKRPDGVSQDT